MLRTLRSAALALSLLIAPWASAHHAPTHITDLTLVTASQGLTCEGINGLRIEVSAEDAYGWRSLVMFNMPTQDGGVYAHGPIRALIKDWNEAHAPQSWSVGFTYTTYYAIHRLESRLQIAGLRYELTNCQIH